MTLKVLKDFFKTAYSWTDSVSIGKIDSDAERAICFYHSRFGSAKIQTVGGKVNRSYGALPVTVLLRWTRNADAAENKAQSIYGFFDEKNFEIDGKRVFIISRYDGPIDLGTDGNGVYEYSFEFDAYYEK